MTSPLGCLTSPGRLEGNKTFYSEWKSSSIIPFVSMGLQSEASTQLYFHSYVFVFFFTSV